MNGKLQGRLAQVLKPAASGEERCGFARIPPLPAKGGLLARDTKQRPNKVHLTPPPPSQMRLLSVFTCSGPVAPERSTHDEQ